MGLEIRARAGPDEQALEHSLDRLRGPEHTVEPSAAAGGPNDGKIARTRSAEALSIEDDRQPGLEERLADDELSPLGDLYDETIAQILRKRRRVNPDPAAPSRSPVAIRMAAFQRKPIAPTPESSI
jgi:hypothetical protein